MSLINIVIVLVLKICGDSRCLVLFQVHGPFLGGGPGRTETGESGQRHQLLPVFEVKPIKKRKIHEDSSFTSHNLRLLFLAVLIAFYPDISN